MKKIRRAITPAILTIAIIATLLPLGSLTALADSPTFSSGDYTYTVTSVSTVSIALTDPTTATATDITISSSVTDPDTLNSYDVTAITDYGFSADPVLETVTIPDSVTSIGAFAFSPQDQYGQYSTASQLKSVTFGTNSELATIGDNAFYICRQLTAFTIPDAVISIGYQTFSNCSGLTQLTLASDSTVSSPDMVIGEQAFAFCEGLTALELPDKATSIGAYAFGGCSNLATVNLGSSIASSKLSEIQGDAFVGCTSLTGITIPDNVTNIRDNAFNGCRELTVVAFGENSNLTTIGNYTFQHCSKLASFTIPKEVTAIGLKALSGTGITSITIPAKVATIGGGAFGGCPALTGITVDPGNTDFVSDSGALLNLDKSTLLQYPAGADAETYAIPVSVTVIGVGAFDSSKITNITIPTGVTSINENAFAYCAGLQTVTFAAGSTLETIGYSAFYSDAMLTQIDIPKSVTEISSFAFQNDSALETVTFDALSELSTIGYYAFDSCSSLTSIELPKDVSSISGNVLSDCSSLESLTVDASNTYYVAENGALYDIDKLELHSYALASSNDTFEIPASVTTIDDALIGAKNLTAISVEEGNTNFKIVDGTLYSDDGTALLYYPMAGLQDTCTILADVTDVELGALINCPNLLNIYVAALNQDYKSIDGVLFNASGEVLQIYPSARTANTYIIPSGTTYLSDYCFVNCKNLTAVVAGSNMSYYNSYAFDGSSGVTLYLVPGSEAIDSAINNKMTYTTKPYLSAFGVGTPTSTGATLKFTSNQAGACSYVVYKKTDTAPADASTVIAQATGDAKGTANTVASLNSISMIGLTATTDYIAYVVVKNSNNDISDVFSLSFTTSAASVGGGGNAPAPGTIVEATGDTTTATTTAEAKIDAIGGSFAAVTGAQMADTLDKALAGAAAQGAGAAAIVEIKVEGAGTSTSVSTMIPQSSFAALAGSSVDGLQITTSLASITFDAAAIDSINGKAAGDVNIKAALADTSKLTDAEKTAVGNHPVYDFTITSGGTTISGFGGGRAMVSVPYKLAAGEDSNKIVIYYLSDSGALVLVPNCAYDASTGMVTFVTDHFSKYAIVCSTVSFSDVSGWYAESVNYLAARDIIHGNDGQFNPNANITRAEFVTILASMSGADLGIYTTSSFADVKTTDWFAEEVQWAYSAGIASGDDGKFSPNALITRQDMAVMIALYAEKLAGYTLNTATAAVSFPDSTDIAGYATDEVTAMQRAGIISGYPDGRFAPKDNASKAQAAKMIALLMQGMIG